MKTFSLFNFSFFGYVKAHKRTCCFSLAMLIFALTYLGVIDGIRYDIAEQLLAKIRNTIIFVGLILSIYLIVIIHLSNKNSWKVENLFLAVFIPISIGMMIVLPITCAPDEPAHLFQTYIIASGQEPKVLTTDESYVEIPDNFFISDYIPRVSLTSLSELRNEDISATTHEGNPFSSTGIYPINNYLPQAIGMRVVSIFTNNLLAQLYGARIGAWLFSVVLMYFAIRIIPCCKYILLMMTLLPMSLQEMISASADGMTISVVAVFVAFILNICINDRPLRKLDFFFIAFLVFCVATFKVFYMPLMFLIFLIPKERFGNSRRKWIAVITILGCTMILLLGWFTFCYLKYFTRISGGNEGYLLPQLSFIIHSPGSFYLVVFRTIMQRMQSYLQALFGGELAWLNISIQSGCSVPIGFVMIYAIIADRGLSEGRMNNRIRSVLVALSAICFIALFWGLYIWWTVPGSPYIAGIQGRYFLPLILPFSIGFKHESQKQIGLAMRQPMLNCCIAMSLLSVCMLSDVLMQTII